MAGARRAAQRVRTCNSRSTSRPFSSSRNANWLKRATAFWRWPKGRLRTSRTRRDPTRRSASEGRAAAQVKLSTAEDHFNYGVERLNARDVELAKHHLGRALALQPDADHVLYTMALCCGLAGDGNGACENLKRAIDLEPRNRILARQDPEFSALASQFPGLRALLTANLRDLTKPRHCRAACRRLMMTNRCAWFRSAADTVCRRCWKASRNIPIRTKRRRADRRRYHGHRTVTDDGGSSGRLRREFDVLPPGDIRNCMVALSEDGALLSRLFQYRFKAGHGLKGHSFGNLFLTALTDITGDFPDAVRSSAEVLKIAGRIFPSTAANVSLEAVLEDGSGRARGKPHQPKPPPHLPDPAAAAPCPAAERNAGRDRARRSDHAGPGLAVHQRDSESAGFRNSEGDPPVARAESVFREPDVAARRDDEFHALRIMCWRCTIMPAANCWTAWW